jgi:ElaB/YqjD/DUF883 family membrane-anchored ribosome-binding protein
MENVMNRDSQDNLKRDFQSTLDDAEELVRMTGDQSGEKVTAARNKVRQSLDRGRSELQRMQTQAGESARRAAYEVDDYVHANPWKTLAMVGLVGVIVGMLITHSDDSDRDTFID